MGENSYEEIQKGSVGKRLKFLLKDSVLYGGVSTISKFLQIFLLPILIRYFSDAEYGVYDTLLVILNLLLVMVNAGTDSSLARFFYENKELKYKQKLVSQTFIFIVSLAIVVAFVFWFLAPVIISFYFETQEYIAEIRMLAFILPVMAIVRFTQSLLKWSFKRLAFIIVSSGSVVFTIILSILFISYIGAKIIYLFYASFISMFIFAIVGIYYSREYFIRIKSFDLIIPQIKFGLPLTFNQLTLSIMPAIERYFVSSFIGINALGLYAIANKIAQLSQFAINGFQVAWGPLAFSIMKEQDSETTYNKTLDYYVVFVSLFIIVFASFMDLIITFMSSKLYLDLANVILILVIGKLILSVSGVTTIGIELSKKTVYKISASIIRLVFSIPIMYLLISYYGIIGVASGLIIGIIIYFIVVQRFANLTHALRFKLIKPALVFLISIILGFIIVVMPNISVVLRFVYMVFSFLIVILSSFFLLLDINEKKAVINYYNK